MAHRALLVGTAAYDDLEVADRKAPHRDAAALAEVLAPGSRLTDIYQVGAIEILTGELAVGPRSAVSPWLAGVLLDALGSVRNRPRNPEEFAAKPRLELPG